VKATKKSANKLAFLAAYRTLGTVLTAARAAGTARTSHYEWLRDDPEYAAAFEQANEDFIESLEASVIESATRGIEEPVIYQGALCHTAVRNAAGELVYDAQGNPVLLPLTIRKRSDVAAFFLLKAKRPNVYREHQTIEHTGAIEIIDRLAAGRARLAKVYAFNDA
jgi:hypothetical protein